ncbi:MAG: hypothetical protein FWF59_01445 [Turicibacter sp.]|nr:hypothetical protein [Turicibacter sp.]
MNCNLISCQSPEEKSCPCPSSPEEACQLCFGFEPGNTGPQGPQGPKGPAGLGVVQPYDPNTGCYAKGAIVWYGGGLWSANVDCPEGAPGSSSDWTMLDPDIIAGATGPEGPQGEPMPAIAQPYVPGGHYHVGDIVYYRGQLYVVTQDDPQGAPGSSPDYNLITGLVVQGSTGPTGPTGGNFPVVYDPNESCSYTAGMVVYYNGNLYEVTKDCPQGVPGSSCDYTLISSQALDGPTGPQGPEGDATAQPYDPDMTYYKGDVIYYQGSLYWVNKDNPQGTPGSSPDYTHIDYLVVKGATGPTGEGFPTAYNPAVSDGYPIGQLVYYNGDIYQVNKLHPKGVPGKSADYTLVAKAPAPETGPPGPTGPEGPSASCSCAASIDQNTDDLDNLESTCDDMKNEINNITDQIHDTENRIKDDQKKAQDNADAIADLEKQVEEQTCILMEVKGSLGQYGCGNSIPFEINSATYFAVPWSGTQSQMLKQGNVVPTGGTFFGCKIYRAMFYGNQSNVLDNITCGTTTSGKNAQMQLLPDCMVSTIVNAGGWYTDAHGNKIGVMKGNFYLDNGWLNMETDPKGGIYGRQENAPYYVYVDFTCCSTNTLPTCPTSYCMDCCNYSGQCTATFCAQTSKGACATGSGATGACNCGSCASGFRTPCGCGCCNVLK